MRTVQSGPVIGLIVQVLLLAALATTVGLSPAGWLAGVAYGVGLCVLLGRGLRRSAAPGLGPADRVTLTRATLVGGVTGLVVDSFTRPVPVALLVTLTVVALALDAVDGKVARRTGTSSALGARFDMEVDAVLLLVLSVYVVPSIGLWALAIGGMRYAFVVAIWTLPWMRGTLPPRYWRKVVAATQGVTLVVATTGLPPRPLMIAALAFSLALLVESFGRDVIWLWRHRRPVHHQPVVPSARLGTANAVRDGRPSTTLPGVVVTHTSTLSGPVRPVVGPRRHGEPARPRPTGYAR